MYDYVITVCDESAAEKCPIFPGKAMRLSWSFEDPSKFEGSYDEKLAKVRIVGDRIKESILEFLAK
jgi:arsenate reductase